jgi:hypothetical protein
MLLVCGGKGLAGNTEIDEEVGIRVVPTVVAYLDEDDPHIDEKLDLICQATLEPFVIRLLDKDFAKLIDSEVGQRIYFRE